MRTKKQRAAACFAALAIVCVTLFSFFLIADVSDHDCAAQDCRICAYIRTAQNTLDQIGTGRVCLNHCALMAVFFLAALSCPDADRFLFASPIDKKVRLNN